jgi:signal transduction histidine kinase
MIGRFLGSVAGRFALAAMACVLLAVAILAIGVMLVGGDLLVHLLMVAGEEAAAARSMFDTSIGPVVLAAAAGALAAAAVLAVVVGRTLSQPIRRLDEAAHRISSGDLDARVPTGGPTELAGLADSFNRMAESLAEQEQLRRDFVANAAHELRTPLTNLKGYLEALRDGVIEPERATFESLMEEAERLVRLSRSLDTLAEGDAGAPAAPLEAVDLALAVRSSVDLARPSFESRRLALAVDVPATLVARANPDHLAQVLGNLLQNALRYTPSGGQVTVRAVRSGDVAMVVVANTGDPIPAADLPRVFERFYRVEKSRDREQGGAGIGLAIVRELVEGDGGEVGVESADGQTRFWFRLPGAAPRAGG